MLPDQFTGKLAKSTARLKASYDQEPDSGAKSTTRSKASYDKYLPKSCDNNAAHI